jgi:hypothetical protein
MAAKGMMKSIVGVAFALPLAARAATIGVEWKI